MEVDGDRKIDIGQDKYELSDYRRPALTSSITGLLPIITPAARLAKPMW